MSDEASRWHSLDPLAQIALTAVGSTNIIALFAAAVALRVGLYRGAAFFVAVMVVVSLCGAAIWRLGARGAEEVPGSVG